jgi:hypothetical protein
MRARWLDKLTHDHCPLILMGSATAQATVPAEAQLEYIPPFELDLPVGVSVLLPIRARGEDSQIIPGGGCCQRSKIDPPATVEN